MSNYLLVLAAAVAWLAWANRAAIVACVTAGRMGATSTTAWQEGWVRTLLRLQKDLEAAGQHDAAALTRELVWRILGGEPHKS